MMKGRDRNSLCWCGSGKKYKKCHLDREKQPKDDPWMAVSNMQRAYQQKKCCASDVGLGPCEGGVIKAHTVSRGPNLSKIAKDGHVVHYTASIPEMNKNGGKQSVRKTGINNASVFNGFCKKHDRDLFSNIENEVFIGRQDQCLAAAYRIVSRELYGKDAQSSLKETLRSADKGKTFFDQLNHQKWLRDIDAGNEAARRDLQATHDALVKALVNNQPGIIQSLVLEFDNILPFMFAGAWSPFSDFFGSKLQDGYEDELLEQVFFSSFVHENKSRICISWQKISNAPGKIIADQIQALPKDQQATACLQIVVKHVENIFFNPDWFEALSNQQVVIIDQLAASGLDFMGSVPSTPLSLNERFGLPNATRAFLV